jgi:hypothetical protein
MDLREHPIRLAGAARADRSAPPLLLAFDQADFVTALEERLLAQPWPARGWPAALAHGALGADGGTPRLLQTLHQRFTVAIVDAHCEVIGAPRLDPRRIASRGLVVRRFVGPPRPGAGDLAEPRHWQGWMGSDAAPLGWQGYADAAAFDADPEATQAPAARTGAPTVDRLLALRSRRTKAAERIVPLWPLSPAIAQALGRTLLFGLVPTAVRVEQAEPDSERRAGFARLRRHGSAERAQLEQLLSPWLRRSSAAAPPRAGANFDRGWLMQTAIPVDEDEFIASVEQLAYELEAFGAHAARWRPLLARVPLWRRLPLSLAPWPYERIDALAFFAACARVVRPELGTPAAVPMPDLIGPAPLAFGLGDPAEPARLLAQMLDAAVDGFEAMAEAAPPQRAPFDDADARYAVRAFVRVQPHDPRCPPRLVWSEPSRLFTIAPWYEGSGRAPAPIALPRLDRASLARLKPSTGFALPAEVRRLVHPNGAPAMLAGNPRRAGAAVDWVLQLSMPIMTVCALVAMTVVLTLLDVVFRWMPFARILLPRLRR